MQEGVVFEKIKAIRECLEDRKLFDRDNDSLSRAGDLLEELERRYGNEVTTQYRNSFHGLKQQYQRCRKIKQELYALVKEKTGSISTSKNIGNWSKREKQTNTLRNILYEGNGVIKIVFLEINSGGYSHPKFGPMPNSEKEKEKEEYFLESPLINISEEKAREINRINREIIPRVLEEISRLLSEEKLEYEKANEKIKDLEGRYHEQISFKNRAVLNELKDKSMKVEKEMQELRKEIGNVTMQVNTLNTQVREVRNDISKLRAEVKRGFQQVTQENTEALRALRENKRELLHANRQIAIIKQQGNSHQRSLEGARGQLQQVRNDQQFHTQKFKELQQKTEGHLQSLEAAKQQLQKVREQQQLHTKEFQKLQQEANTQRALMAKANKQLGEIEKTQQKHTEEFLKVQKEATEHQASLNQANQKLREMRQTQHEHTEEFRKASERAAAHRVTLEQTQQKLVEVQAKQQEHTQAFENASKQAATHQAALEGAQQKLREMQQKQQEHTTAFQELKQKAERHQLLLNEANQKLVEVRVEQQKHTEEFVKVQKEAAEHQASLDRANQKLSDVQVKQQEHTEAFRQAAATAAVHEASLQQANQKLVEVQVKQQEHTEAFRQAAATAAVHEASLRQANQKLSEVQSKQQEHTTKFQQLQEEAKTQQQLINEANHKLSDVQATQRQHTTEFKELQEKADVQQQSINQANRHLSEVKATQGQHTAQFKELQEKADKHQESINQAKARFEKAHKKFSKYLRKAEKSSSQEGGFKQALENFRAEIEKNSYGEMSQHFAPLSEVLQEREAMRKKLFDQTKKQYEDCRAQAEKEEKNEALAEKVALLETRLSDMILQHAKWEDQDLKEMENHKRFVQSQLEEVRKQQDKFSKQKQKKLEEADSYTKCNDNTDMPTLWNTNNKDNFRHYTDYYNAYKEGKHTNLKQIIQEFDKGIAFIMACARNDQKISHNMYNTLQALILAKNNILRQQVLDLCIEKVEAFCKQEKQRLNEYYFLNSRELYKLAWERGEGYLAAEQLAHAKELLDKAQATSSDNANYQNYRQKLELKIEGTKKYLEGEELLVKGTNEIEKEEQNSLDLFRKSKKSFKEAGSTFKQAGGDLYFEKVLAEQIKAVRETIKLLEGQGAIEAENKSVGSHPASMFHPGRPNTLTDNRKINSDNQYVQGNTFKMT